MLELNQFTASTDAYTYVKIVKSWHIADLTLETTCVCPGVPDHTHTNRVSHTNVLMYAF